MEGLKSHKDKQVEENLEILVAKRNKDSAPFFSKDENSILLQNTNHSSEQKQKWRCLCSVGMYVICHKEAASAKSETVVLNELYSKFLEIS